MPDPNRGPRWVALNGTRHFERPGRAAGTFQEQLRSAFDRTLLVLRVDAALESLRGIRNQSVTTTERHH
jgi:hypothetical protein